MAVELPHFRFPFTITHKGEVEVVEQGTPECEASRVANVCVCEEGYREDEPEFGIPPVPFQTVPLQLAQMEAAIERWVPNAELASNEQAHDVLEQAVRIVTVEVG